MEYSTSVLLATEIATFFLSPKQGDLQILFLVERWNLFEQRHLCSLRGDALYYEKII